MLIVQSICEKQSKSEEENYEKWLVNTKEVNALSVDTQNALGLSVFTTLIQKRKISELQLKD